MKTARSTIVETRSGVQRRSITTYAALAAVFLVSNASASVTLFCESIGGNIVSEDTTVEVECFVTNDSGGPQGFRNCQIDLPCSLPGHPCSSEMIAALPGLAGGTTDPDGDGLHGPSSGGIPFLFGITGLGPYAPITCISAATPCPGMLPVVVPAGETRYLGTRFYDVSSFAAGDFDLFFECVDQPGGICDNVPEATNTTRCRDDGPGAGNLIPLNLMSLVLSVVPNLDCNNNGHPDDCDIGSGVSLDCNVNGIPDECESPNCPAELVLFDINNGGLRSTGGPYAITASTGQHGGIGPIASADYELRDGFWHAFAGACGPCQLYGDVVSQFCLVDVDDLICVLDDFVDPAFCSGKGDIFPCGGGDDIYDVDDISAVLGVFTGFYACPHPCPM